MFKKLIEKFIDFFKDKKKESITRIKLKVEESPGMPGLRFYRRLRQLVRQQRRASQHYNRN